LASLGDLSEAHRRFVVGVSFQGYDGVPIRR
jgi:hypothetical protein